MSPSAETDESTSRESVRGDIRDAATFNRRYIIMNSLAAVVASYGILTNSIATVIGAMVIARLLDSISGLALALVDGDTPLLEASIKSGIAGASFVLIISFLIGLIHQSLPTTDLMLRLTHPSLPDLIVALAGGTAGAYATISARISAGLVGVAIATAMVPPLSTCGICAAKGEFGLAAGALELFVANFAAIQLSMSVTMWFNGFRGIRGTSTSVSQVIKRNTPTLVILLLLFTLLGLNFVRAARDQAFERRVRQSVQQFAQDESMDVLQVTFNHRQSGIVRVIVTFASLEPLAKLTIDRFESELPARRGAKVQLDARYIIVNKIQPPDTEVVEAVGVEAAGAEASDVDPVGSQ